MKNMVRTVFAPTRHCHYNIINVCDPLSPDKRRSDGDERDGTVGGLKRGVRDRGVIIFNDVHGE